MVFPVDLVLVLDMCVTRMMLSIEVAERAGRKKCSPKKAERKKKLLKEKELWRKKKL